MEKNLCVLATDFSSCDDDMKVWQQEREKKSNIYKSFNDYILCLEDSKEHEEDPYKKYLIEKEIKKLKKEQKKYYVPGILEGSKFELVKDNEPRKQALERSSFSLVKRLRKK